MVTIVFCLSYRDVQEERLRILFFGLIAMSIVVVAGVLALHVLILNLALDV